MEVRAEKRLRETAEQRAGRLSQNVSKLVGSTSAQQSTIGQLSKRLQRVRDAIQQKEQQCADAALKNNDLKLKLKKPLKGLSSGDEALSAPRTNWCLTPKAVAARAS